MGVSYIQLKLLIEESKKRAFSGSVLQLGRQSISLNREQFLKWSQEEGFSPDKVSLSSNKFDDVDFFTGIGFDEVRSLDISSYENADIILDLNEPVPEAYHSLFDCVIDSGTMEHCFNVVEVLRNINRMLKPGGRVIHLSPTSNCVDHGFYMFSPSLFWDFYLANNWDISSCRLISSQPLNKSSQTVVYDYLPNSMVYQSIGGLRLKGIFNTWFIARKNDHSTGTVIPQQNQRPDFTKSTDCTFELSGKRVALFGASKLGSEAYSYLADCCEIICFLDNAAQKSGTVFEGREVRLVTQVDLDSLDYFVISSQYTKEIIEQLKNLNVDDEKIRVYIHNKDKVVKIMPDIYRIYPPYEIRV